MKENLQSDSDLIYGIERQILEDFLTLIKIAYPLVDEANYFLEIETEISGINIAITNQRDVLSHLHTMISDTSLTYEGRLEQLSTAEEHLRRAAIEPYFKAISVLTDRIRTLYDNYKVEVVPLKDHNTALAFAPTISQIDKRLENINKARTEARRAKRRNKLDEGWTDGVKILIETFRSLKDLQAELVTYITQAQQIKANEEQARANTELIRKNEELLKKNEELVKDSRTHLKLGWTHIVLVIVIAVFTIVFEHYIWPMISHNSEHQTSHAPAIQNQDQQITAPPSK